MLFALDILECWRHKKNPSKASSKNKNIENKKFILLISSIDKLNYINALAQSLLFVSYKKKKNIN